MRVFGIDCGTEVTGFGVVESCDAGREPRLVCKAMGAIRLSKNKSTPARLEQIFRELTAELEQWKPDAVAIEEVFYSVNAKSALKLGQVRGVALLAAACQKLPVAEYAPLTIKSSVVGYGLAKQGAGAVHGGAAAETGRSATAGGRGRRPGHCHLPHSYRADACLAGAMRQ
jgi:crossover junction endodeoxyribonuclease RuvC